MADVNGNLSLEERRALKPGQVVAFQAARMLSEQTGTIEAVGRSGRLELCDGSFVSEDDYLRLVSATPMVPTTVEVRGVDGVGVKPGKADGEASGVRGTAAPRTPRESSDRQTPASTPASPAAACADAGTREDGTGKAPAGKRRVGRPFPKADREAWLVAVTRVRQLMGTGMHQEDAIKRAKEEYPDLRMTKASMQWWQRRFVKEGAMELGPRRMPKKKVPAATGTEVAVAAMEEMRGYLSKALGEKAGVEKLLEETKDQLAAARTSGDAARAAHEAALKELDDERKISAAAQAALNRTTDELLKLKADMAALAVETDERLKAANARLPAGVSLRETLREARALLKGFAAAVALADLGQIAADDVRMVLDACRKRQEKAEKEGQG